MCQNISRLLTGLEEHVFVFVVACFYGFLIVSVVVLFIFQIVYKILCN